MYTYFYLLYIAIIDHSTSTYFSTDTTCVASTYISSYVHIGRPKCVLTVLTDAHRTTIAGGAWWAGGGELVVGADAGRCEGSPSPRLHSARLLAMRLHKLLNFVVRQHKETLFEPPPLAVFATPLSAPFLLRSVLHQDDHPLGVVCSKNEESE